MGKASRRRLDRKPAHVVETVAPQTVPVNDRRTAIAIAIALALITLIAFSGVRNHDFTNFDDPEYVTENDHVRAGLTADNIAWAFTTFHASNWHPVTWLSHMLDVEMFGVDAGKHLLTNVVIHALNAVLLFFALRAATLRTWPSATVAALFALHPMHVESVAWIAERKDVLSAFFFMLTLYAYIRYARARSKAAYALTIVAFALGLMAKPMLVTVPMVLLLLDIWPLQRAERWRTLIIEKLPLFVLIIPSVILTLKAQTQAIAPLALPYRLSNAAQSYVAYLWKMIWPTRLAVIYPYRTVLSPTLTLIALIVLAAITVLALRQARTRPYLLVGWLWFAGTLVPVIGIIQVGQQAMADRYTYLPFIGAFIALVWLAFDVIRSTKVLAVAGAAIVVVLAAATHVQAAYWKDSITLFQHAVDVTERNRVAHTNLGAAYLRQLGYTRAESEFRAALAISDRDSLAHTGLGITLTKLGSNADAERELRAALALDPKKADVYRMLGRIALGGGRTDEAISLLQKAQQISDDPETRAILALARGDNARAIGEYEEAVRRDPESADLHNDLAASLARAGRDAEALAQYHEALRLAPRQYDAHMNLGALLSRQEKDAEAAEEFLAAAQESPRSAEPHVYVALVYAKLGRFRDAEREMTTAIQIDPVGSNTILTNAIHIPPAETNAEEYLAALRARGEG